MQERDYLATERCAIFLGCVEWLQLRGLLRSRRSGGSRRSHHRVDTCQTHPMLVHLTKDISKEALCIMVHEEVQKKPAGKRSQTPDKRLLDIGRPVERASRTRVERQGLCLRKPG